MTLTAPRIGSLFSGYGGLDMGVQAVIGGSVAFHIEYDKAPSQILEHHWPEVPNYGDVTAIDWATVPMIDALTAGYPCQPFSGAGKRKGADDERHLWPYVLTAVRQLRPRVVVLENVRGHLTLGFDRVLGDLAEVGYDARWICLPASDAGAPHRRERIFVLAYARGDEPERWGIARDLGSATAEDEGTSRERERIRDASRDRGPTHADAHYDAARGGFETLDSSGSGPEPSQRGIAPTDADSGRPEERLWDWPEAAVSVASEYSSHRARWGEYSAAIERWESVLGRIAPDATDEGENGRRRLSPRFVEWMMGLPAGHVTDTGIARSAQLKALGNGVVPQQAALALSILLGPQSHSLPPTRPESTKNEGA